MAFADYAAYKSAVEDSLSRGALLAKTAANITMTGGRLMDMFVTMAPAGVAPTTAVVPTNATTGSFEQHDGASGRLTFAAINATLSAATVTNGAIIIADRLSHQGGLSGTVTTAQTTNLPTAALTRYTSGDGVMIGLSIYTAIGTTGTTVTASYTNQAGTAGKTTQAVVFGGTGYREAARMILLPLAVGDTGCRSVESVTVLATTGTAGNFGVMLFKPLIMAPFATSTVSDADFVSGGMMGGFPEIVDGACLFPIGLTGNTGISGTIMPMLVEA